MAYITSEQYRDAVFNEDARHQLKVIFNGVELEDADNYCEKFTLKSRIISNSSKTFSLDTFVSDEAQLILHDIDLEQIVGPVEIQIGTLVGETYEYVPIGIFNIQGTPTTDKNKTTIKLRDNSVKFDFNYNAKLLIDTVGVVVDETTGAKAVTKLQILKDICSQAGIVCNVTNFLGSSDYVGFYDDSILARTYISYLAEQAGAIATINRFGELIFVYLNALVDQPIPMDYVESYENGQKFKISRVIYEDGIRKFATPLEEENIDGDNLYLNTANPFIESQEQVDAIYEIVKDVEINSFKTGKIIGNPAIDKYDIIQIAEDYLTFRTFATYNMTYNGKIIMTFETLIDQVKKQENVSKNSEESFKRYAKTSIDNINAKIELVAKEQNGIQEQLAKMEINTDNIQNLFQVTGGNNLIKDSQLLLGDDVWVKEETEVSNYVGGYDDNLVGKTVSTAKIGIKNGKMTTTSTNITDLVINSQYTLSYKISNDEYTTTTIRLIGNDVVYEKTFTEKTEFEEVVFSFISLTPNYILEIESSTELDGYGYIYDLMLNKGDVSTWQPASGEIVGTVIKLSQMGMQIYCTGSEIATLLTSAGFQIRRFEDGTMYEVITKFTKDGFISKKGSLVELQVNKYDIKTINYQGYETLIIYKMDGDL